MEMFSIIGIPYKNVEHIKFEDFILIKDNIKEKLSSLQVNKYNIINIKIMKVIFKLHKFQMFD